MGSLPPEAGANKNQRVPGRGIQDWLSTYVSALRVAAVIGAWAAVVASLVTWTGRSTLVGLIIGLSVTLLGGFVASAATARTANHRRHITLADWSQVLSGKVGPNDPGRAGRDLKEAMEQFALHGPQWITGEGYVDVSRLLAQVEADLLDSATVTNLLDVAQYDNLRLMGSTVPNKQELLNLLTTSLSELEKEGADPALTNKAPSSSTTANAVKQVREALNDYRDSSREGLARLRTHTLDAVALSGTLTYLLLVDVKVYTLLGPQAASAIAFFLVAALVGVISALTGLSNLSTAEDDFGLASMRLVANSILSGLCGVGGVVLINLAATAAVQLGAASGAASSARSNGGSSGSVPSLDQILDVVNHPVALVLAAVFGVTPTLLLNGLTSLGQKYSKGLTSTRPSNADGSSGSA